MGARVSSIMSPLRVVLGFAVSIMGGDLVVRPLVVRMWRYLFRRSDLPEEYSKKSEMFMLTMPMGMLERGLYTGALIMGMWQLIGGWFALKIAAKWKRPSEYRGADNVWLIGSGLSLFFGFLGAWIALGHLPTIR
jgi:hypothetical protein